jgi:hypothetical protein
MFGSKNGHRNRYRSNTVNSAQNHGRSLIQPQTLFRSRVSADEKVSPCC